MINNILQTDQSFFYTLNGLLGHSGFFDAIVKVLSVYLVYCVPIGLLIAWFILKKDQQKIDLIKVTLASFFIWQVPTRLISMLWFRPRPIAELAGAKEVVFHVPSYSFPSDHSTFLAALATYFYLLGYKKVATWIYVVAFLVGTTRIIGGMHYPLDVLAGWTLGIVGAYLIHLLDKYIQKYLAQPILKIAKWIKLA